VRTIGSQGSGNLQFKEPCGVAVLEDGNLVVCDLRIHRLQILTVGGDFVRIIPFFSPLSVAVLDRDHVAVGSANPLHCVDIVRISG